MSLVPDLRLPARYQSLDAATQKQITSVHTNSGKWPHELLGDHCPDTWNKNVLGKLCKFAKSVSESAQVSVEQLAEKLQAECGPDGTLNLSHCQAVDSWLSKKRSSRQSGRMNAEEDEDDEN
ncbi:hypothetical protein FAVG1_13083 [Fusarium avenaceum]|nr:hypothetical protein FAVG1_13083 [Fusarium avenaceum]